MASIGVKGKRFLVMGLMLSLMVWCVPAGWAEEAKPEEPEKFVFNAQVDFLSQYVWRGIALSTGSLVMQPSFTGSFKGFSFNVWSNVDMNEKNPYGKNPRRGFAWNETDLTGSYSREVYKNLTLTGGVIFYILDGNNSIYNSLELFGGADYKLPWFNFGANVYREINHYPGTFLQWYVHRAFDLPWYGMNLDLLASWSAEFSNDKAAYPVFNSSGNLKNEYYNSLHAGFIGATLNIPVGKYIVVAPKVQYWYALGGASTGTISALSWDGKHNQILGGVNITVNF
jgi:hypothetical protein